HCELLIKSGANFNDMTSYLANVKCFDENVKADAIEKIKQISSKYTIYNPCAISTLSLEKLPKALDAYVSLFETFSEQYTALVMFINFVKRKNLQEIIPLLEAKLLDTIDTYVYDNPYSQVLEKSIELAKNDHLSVNLVAKLEENLKNMKYVLANKRLLNILPN